MKKNVFIVALAVICGCFAYLGICEHIAVVERDVKTAFNRLDEVCGDVKRLQDHQNGVNNHE